MLSQDRIHRMYIPSNQTLKNGLGTRFSAACLDHLASSLRPRVFSLGLEASPPSLPRSIQPNQGTITQGIKIPGKEEAGAPRSGRSLRNERPAVTTEGSLLTSRSLGITHIFAYTLEFLYTYIHLRVLVHLHTL